MGGMIPSPLGLTAFLGMRVAGYYVAYLRLQRHSDRPRRAETFVGAKVAAGAVVGGLALSLQIMVGGSDVQLWTALLPLRLIAWLLLIRMLVPPRNGLRAAVGFACLATVWSYVLDAVAWLVFRVVPGFVMPWC